MIKKGRLRMKIALFGGSFDPPHVGHLQIIKTASEQLFVDRVFVNVAYRNPFKSTSSSDAMTRLRWMKKLCKGIKKAKVLSYEVKQDRPVPTIETVLYLYRKYSITKLYLIIGADNLKSLKKWYKYKKLKKLVQFVVVTRDGIQIDGYKQLVVDVNISSSKLRKKLKKRYIPKKIKKEIRKIYG